MNDLIKIKMSDAEIDFWPQFLLDAVKNKNHFHLDIESEHKLHSLREYLHFTEGKLKYHSMDLGIMCFDFFDIDRYHQRQNYALSREPLAKALGIKGNDSLNIWDTTCGTAKDSILINHFGAKLTSFERHPVIYLLLIDALRRYPLNFEIIFADTSMLYFNIAEENRPDVIYYDPMYPEKLGSKKSALPRKEMRIFKEIVGNDLDSKIFLEWSLKTAKKRVVVKRSINALPILENPTASYVGKSTRYDMYKIF